MTAEEKSKPSDQQPQQQGCTPIPGTAYCVPASSPTVYHSKSPAPVVTSHGGGVGRNNVTDEEVEVDGDGKKNADLSNETSAVTTMIRKLSAEFAGTSSLVFIVVGSGIHATQLSDDIGIQLTINSLATAFGLYGLITIFGPVSGAHFNPIVSLVDVLYRDMTLSLLALYVPSQIVGGIVGSVLANVIFDVPTKISTKDRWGYNLWISEILATMSLIVIIHGCIRTGEKGSVPTAVAAWVGGGYFFTSSTIFANPAVTIGRMFTDTFAGINPRSMGVYIPFQIIGAVLGWFATKWFYPKMAAEPKKEDPLYQRVCIMVDRKFYEKGAY